MGTRGNVVVQERGKNLVRIYRQFDTYLSGMGAHLKEILGDDPEIVNGYSSGHASPQVFNGTGCLSAYLIGALKGGQIGNVYVHPVDEEPDGLWIEYVYTLYVPETEGEGRQTGRLHIKVETSHGGDTGETESIDLEDGRKYDRPIYTYRTLYDGPFKDFDPVPLEEALYAEREEVEA